jgi:hypothetical protein
MLGLLTSAIVITSRFLIEVIGNVIPTVKFYFGALHLLFDFSALFNDNLLRSGSTLRSNAFNRVDDIQTV